MAKVTAVRSARDELLPARIRASVRIIRRFPTARARQGCRPVRVPDEHTLPPNPFATSNRKPLVRGRLLRPLRVRLFAVEGLVEANLLVRFFDAHGRD